MARTPSSLCRRLSHCRRGVCARQQRHAIISAIISASTWPWPRCHPPLSTLLLLLLLLLLRRLRRV
jgi:hypothetical protein